MVALTLLAASLPHAPVPVRHEAVTDVAIECDPKDGSWSVYWHRVGRRGITKASVEKGEWVRLEGRPSSLDELYRLEHTKKKKFKGTIWRRPVYQSHSGQVIGLDLEFSDGGMP